MSGLDIRPIRAEDDPAMARIIRAVMPEFGATGSGFAINDPEVDWMSRAYAEPGCAYFVVERDGVVLGGGGVAHLEGGEADVCELRKMYFLPQARGRGSKCVGCTGRDKEAGVSVHPVLRTHREALEVPAAHE